MKCSMMLHFIKVFTVCKSTCFHKGFLNTKGKIPFFFIEIVFVKQTAVPPFACRVVLFLRRANPIKPPLNCIMNSYLITYVLLYKSMLLVNKNNIH